jgi:hypothetical protein
MRVLGAVVLGAVVLAGCGEDRGSSTGASTGAATTTTSAEAPDSQVSFVTPKDGASSDGTVKAKVALENFELAPQAVGQAPRPGEGHLHFQMDGGKFDYPKYSGANGKTGKKLGVQGKYSPSTTPEITYRDLPPGKHTLEVYLANNNHTELPVEAEVEFEVK